MSLSNFSVGWFDFAALLTVLVGVQLGNKRGMSKEFLSFVQWCLIVVGAAVAYPVLGELVATFAGLGLTAANVLSYLLVMGVIKLFFMFLTSRLGEKIEARHIFGSMEYYLGPVAGGVRFACIVLVTLAFLHVATQTSAQRERDIKYQKDNYGAVYFPTLGLLNFEVFNKSYSGRWINKNLQFLLISQGSTAQVSSTGQDRKARS